MVDLGLTDEEMGILHDIIDDIGDHMYLTPEERRLVQILITKYLEPNGDQTR